MLAKTNGIDLLSLGVLLRQNVEGTNVDLKARQLAQTAKTIAEQASSSMIDHDRINNNAIEANNIKNGEINIDKLSNSLINTINAKADESVVMDISDSSLTVTLSNNIDYRCQTLTELNITLDENHSNYYASSISFTSGTNATNFNCPTPLFTGEDCNNNVFEPEPNKRYNMVVFWDGLYMIGLVIGNELIN